MFGDFLYSLTPRDQKSLGIDLYRRHLDSGSVVGTVLYELAQVPVDRALVLQSIVVTATPNGAATEYNQDNSILAGTYATETTIPSVVQYLQRSQKGLEYYNNFAGYVGNIYDTFEFDNLLIPSGSAIGVRGSFAGATAGNRLQCWITGYTIPRGTIAGV